MGIEDATNTPSPDSRKLRVLVADDGPDVVAWLGVLLRQAGHDVRTAVNGKQACATAAEFHPDVALLDLGLPDMDGCEVARAIHAQPGSERTLLVATTGWGEAEDKLRAREAGFQHHLVKPVRSDALLALLKDAAKGLGKAAAH